LGPGQTARADFTAKLVPAFRIQGTVSPVGQGTGIGLETPDGDNAGFFIRANPRTGRWTIPAVPNGMWIVTASTNGPNGGYYSEQSVSVNGSDIANVSLQLQPGVSIPLHVINAAESGPTPMLTLVQDPPAVTAKLGRDEYYPNRLHDGAPDANAGNNPEQGFMNVRPGHYRLVARGFPSACIGSITSGGTDLEREGLTVSPGAAVAPIEITLGTNCGTIAINVNGSGAASVLIIPERPLLQPIMIQAGGRAIQISNLPPGNYRVYAFDDASGLEYANPEVMRSFSSKEVSLDANQSAQVTLDIVKLKSEGSTESASR
ncbi:MAG: hypothetical protein JO061_06980, partial [Acidobacteriaceae bacterium]|nr:hypothetical protein [Acidobacteriaceae bacterium]